jgi:hypothetical protein
VTRFKHPTARTSSVFSYARNYLWWVFVLHQENDKVKMNEAIHSSSVRGTSAGDGQILSGAHSQLNMKLLWKFHYRHFEKMQERTYSCHLSKD